jgi:hypothetical protein
LIQRTTVTVASMASSPRSSIKPCESGFPPTLPLVLELNEKKEELDALVHKATIDAYRRWAGHA